MGASCTAVPSCSKGGSVAAATSTAAGKSNPALNSSPSWRKQGFSFGNGGKRASTHPNESYADATGEYLVRCFCNWSAVLTRDQKKMYFRLSVAEVSLGFLPRRVLTVWALFQLHNAFLKALNKRKILLQIAWGTLTLQACIFCSRIPVPR